jgi:hypothetical protein
MSLEHRRADPTQAALLRMPTGSRPWRLAGLRSLRWTRSQMWGTRPRGIPGDRLRDTFVDSGVAAALEAVDHQVLYGRRGTGKTHAFRYLENVVRGSGDFAIYADLRTIGSPDGLFVGQSASVTQRAVRLMVDLLGHVHDSLLEAALNDEALTLATPLGACGHLSVRRHVSYRAVRRLVAP